MAIVHGNPFAIDWTDKDAVIAYAKKLGPGQVVYKHPDRSNYNITFVCRADLYRLDWVVYVVPS